MSSYGSLETSLLISVQGFAFRVRPVSLPVASAFPAGVFALHFNQQLEAITYIKPMFTTTIKKPEQVRFSIKNQTRSDKICLS
ncbi:hypothetical protein BMD_3206 [Priestia megaterium DSM 319]|uniref:Uncharacterized protein n=1 Tax=Priestia megaterium (strain DSM 319 / IMG 1521) TaxID=592022 RepID=D5DI74_PRIM3|nr:hypothetical protein BMD_3206 [Priestia megaterium DSM 319]